MSDPRTPERIAEDRALIERAMRIDTRGYSSSREAIQYVQDRLAPLPRELRVESSSGAYFARRYNPATRKFESYGGHGWKEDDADIRQRIEYWNEVAALEHAPYVGDEPPAEPKRYTVEEIVERASEIVYKYAYEIPRSDRDSTWDEDMRLALRQVFGEEGGK